MKRMNDVYGDNMSRQQAEESMLRGGRPRGNHYRGKGSLWKRLFGLEQNQPEWKLAEERNNEFSAKQRKDGHK